MLCYQVFSFLKQAELKSKIKKLSIVRWKADTLLREWNGMQENFDSLSSSYPIPNSPSVFKPEMPMALLDIISFPHTLS